MTLGASLLLLGLTIAIAGLTVALVVWTRYGWARIQERARDREERIAAEEAATRRAAEAHAAAMVALGPWADLVAAIEERPAGRWRVPLSTILDAPNLPESRAVDRYLFDRWPGIELYRTENSLDGIEIQWAGRP